MEWETKRKEGKMGRIVGFVIQSFVSEDTKTVKEGKENFEEEDEEDKREGYKTKITIFNSRRN